jgi:hypothetical protein
MRRPSLVRRRTVYLPTVWGWLLLLAVCGAAAAFAVRHAYDFLAVTRPVSAPLLVIEGWLPFEELDQALTVYRAGGYAHVITTGGPITDYGCDHDASYAERARSYLVRRGVPEADVSAVPAPASAQDRSFLNAVMLRDWLARSQLHADALNVVSSGVHSRRSWMLHQMAFGPETRVGVLAMRPTGYDPGVWWRTSAGAKDVLGEGIGWLWTELFFHPGAPGSHDELWGAGH